jgi:hypothetical protein
VRSFFFFLGCSGSEESAESLGFESSFAISARLRFEDEDCALDVDG